MKSRYYPNELIMVVINTDRELEIKYEYGHISLGP